MKPHDLPLSLTEAILRSSATSAPGPEAQGGEGVSKSAFTITISREVGALGTSVAREVGRQLDWPVYDQEIINKVAEEMGRPAFQLRGIDERHVSWLEDIVSNLTSEFRVSPTAYLRKLVGTIRGLGLVGRCVLVGRGANFILPPESTLRVRLVADRRDRIANISRLQGISDSEADDFITQTEESRAVFANKNFNRDVADPHNYDLVLNMSRLTVQEAADAISNLLHRFEQRQSASAEIRG